MHMDLAFKNYFFYFSHSQKKNSRKKPYHSTPNWFFSIFYIHTWQKGAQK